MRECHPWCKMVQKWKKMMQNAKKVTRNTLLYTICFSHFVSISCYFAISVYPASGIKGWHDAACVLTSYQCHSLLVVPQHCAIFRAFTTCTEWNPMGKNCRLKKKRSPTNGSHEWETIWESTESVEGNVNGLRQTDICIRLRDKSFHLWDPFEGEKWR